MPSSKPLSKTAAKRQAHRESHMYRQGGGWILSTWDDMYRQNVTSGELSHSVARQALADWRAQRIAVLLAATDTTEKGIDK